MPQPWVRRLSHEASRSLALTGGLLRPHAGKKSRLAAREAADSARGADRRPTAHPTVSFALARRDAFGSSELSRNPDVAGLAALQPTPTIVPTMTSRSIPNPAAAGGKSAARDTGMAAHGITVDATVHVGRVPVPSPTVASPHTIAHPSHTAVPTTITAATFGTTILSRRLAIRGNRFVAVATRAVSTLTTKDRASYPKYIVVSASRPPVARKTPAGVAGSFAASYVPLASLLAGVW